MINVKSERFSRSTRSNKIGAKDGTPPLTIVEFSLTNESRDALKQALDIHRHTDYGAAEYCEKALAKIFRDNTYFPAAVLDELTELAKVGGAPTTVYVVKNLPEVAKHDIPKDLLHSETNGDLKQWMLDNSYSETIGHGIGLAIGLFRDGKGLHLSRYPKTQSIVGSNVHKHDHPVSTLGAVINDCEAATRFSDIRAAREAWPLGEPKTLNELASKKFSQDVILRTGDLALWTSNGDIYHQAIKKVPLFAKRNTLLRYVIEQDFFRPHTQSR